MTTLNPYRLALGQCYRRLLWDLTAESRRSRSRLRELRDSQVGKKCIILCNGPSLNKVDFDALKASGSYTIGLNKINFLFDKTEFRPSIICAVNKHVIEQNSDFFEETDIPVFLDSGGRPYISSSAKNVFYLHSAYVKGGFAKDCSMSIFQGNTVTYVAMQLAYHLGFEHVAVVGCDHYFSTKGEPNKLVSSGDDDPNHFAKNYFSGGDKWQLPDLDESEVSYLSAKIAFNRSGRSLVNCTDGGALELFPRVTLEAFLNN